MQNLIKEFMAQKRFAIIGATDDPQKFGNKILNNLIARGYEVYPVNPKLGKIEGIRCYPSISEVPVKVDVVDFVVPPKVTEATLPECRQLGLNRIWLQPGAESAAAIAYCRENQLGLVYNDCVMTN
ncbi:CoA-binding protein [Chloroflexota bacterium]